MKAQDPEISVILQDWSREKKVSAEELFALVYGELRKLAGSYLRRGRSGHTLQPTALVHEAYIKLVDITDIQWADRSHFFAVSASIMRNILVDHERSKNADKRGGGASRIPIDDLLSLSTKPDVDILELDEALVELAKFDAKQSQIVELRFFGGLTIEDTATVLGISPATVKREWTIAKAWLHRRLKSDRQ